MRPLLCQCVILTSLHEDLSEPFLLLTSSLTSCFPVSPASAGSAVTQHFIHNTHWWLQQETGQIQQPIDFKQYPTIYFDCFSSVRCFLKIHLEPNNRKTTAICVAFKDTSLPQLVFHLSVTFVHMYNIINCLSLAEHGNTWLHSLNTKRSINSTAAYKDPTAS